MKIKPYGYKLPRCMTKKQFKAAYRQYRRIVGASLKKYISGGSKDIEPVMQAMTLLSEKYGRELERINMSQRMYSCFWDISSFKKHEPSVVRSLMNGNHKGNVRDRHNSKLRHKSIKDETYKVQF